MAAATNRSPRCGPGSTPPTTVTPPVYGPLNRATIVSGEPDPETGLATVSRRRPRMGGFRQDPDYVTVLALEHYDDETGHAAKAAIFSQRVNQRPQRRTRADSPDEAIRLCLDARGRLDLHALAGLLASRPTRCPLRSRASRTSIRPLGSG